MTAAIATENIPEYLTPYIAVQDPSLYTPMDHAGWRFILKIAQAFFEEHAHPMYLSGLEKTGISTQRIPLITEMDHKLRRFGWRAVPVCGFIPPSVFMEFLSLGILPIACDMRNIENLAYTPAPDIVHEAAGHAPIIADPAYANYLRQYGEISRKAIYSSQDWEVYAAIRDLSITKENPNATTEALDAAQDRLNAAIAAVDYVSEATELARMSWWTIEYGLIGNTAKFKIYGAGLLSSIGESYKCVGPDIKKIALTLDCIRQSYDITRPQPQLYVAPDFHSLTSVLRELEQTMAFRRGGIEGLQKAKRAGTVTTVVLDSGLQISGTLRDFDSTWLQYEGPCQLACDDIEIPGYGPRELAHGLQLFFIPDRGSNFTIEAPSDTTSSVDHEGKTLFKYLASGTVRRGRKVLARAEGKNSGICLTSVHSVISVFGGAADLKRFYAGTGGFHQTPSTPKTNLTDENADLNRLYGEVRTLRQNVQCDPSALNRIHSLLEQHHRHDWLLRYELLELAAAWKLQAKWIPAIHERLKEIADSDAAKAEMIERGLNLIR